MADGNSADAAVKDAAIRALAESENPEALAGALANARISLKATAFAYFKTKYGLGRECFWFYPAQKNLGKKSSSLDEPEAGDGEGDSIAAPAAEKPTVEDPLKKVMSDLKPKK